LKEIIVEISKSRLGATAVVDNSGKLSGVITDGDLRRMLETNISLDNVKAENILHRNPKTVFPDELAVNALDILRVNDISQLVVTNEDGEYLGMLHLHDIVKEGIV
jgi:arabinose-5-phosphate isomerase